MISRKATNGITYMYACYACAMTCDKRNPLLIDVAIVLSNIIEAFYPEYRQLSR